MKRLQTTFLLTMFLFISISGYSYGNKRNTQFFNYKYYNSGKVIKKILEDYDYMINIKREELPATPDMMLLGKKVTPALRRGLINNINDNIRSYCARVLLEMRDKTSVPELRIALKDRSSAVRRYAIRTLGIIGDVDSIDAIIKAADDKNSYVRAEAVSTLGKLGLAEGSKYIIDALKDSSSYVRSQASQALISVKDRSYEDELIKLLNDDSFSVRKNAVMVLARMKSHKATKKLMELMEEDSRNFSTYAYGLYLIDPDLTQKTLFEKLKDQRGYIRLNACYALGRNEMSNAVKPLLEMLSDPNEWVRANAVLALGKIGKGFNVTELSLNFPKETPLVKENIIKALGMIISEDDSSRDELILEVIKQALKDKSYYVRRRAALILAKHKDKDTFFEVLEELSVINNVKNGYRRGFDIINNYADNQDLILPILKRAYQIHYYNSYAKRMIIELFSSAFDEEVKSLLKDSFYFDNNVVKRKVVYAIGMIKDNSSKNLLKYGIKNRDLYVRLNSAFAMFRIGLEEGFEYLVENLFNASTTLQKNIVYLLKEADIDSSSQLVGYLNDSEADIFDKINVAQILLSYENEKALVFLVSLVEKGNYFSTLALNIFREEEGEWIDNKLKEVVQSHDNDYVKKEISFLLKDKEHSEY